MFSEELSIIVFQATTVGKSGGTIPYLTLSTYISQPLKQAHLKQIHSNNQHIIIIMIIYTCCAYVAIDVAVSFACTSRQESIPKLLCSRPLAVKGKLLPRSFWAQLQRGVWSVQDGTTCNNYCAVTQLVQCILFSLLHIIIGQAKTVIQILMEMWKWVLKKQTNRICPKPQLWSLQLFSACTASELEEWSSQIWLVLDILHSFARKVLVIN